MNDSSHEKVWLGNTVSLWTAAKTAAGKYSQAQIQVFFCYVLADIGNYRQKSNELPLQVFGIKSNFLVTIQLSENVTEFLSNYMSS